MSAVETLAGPAYEGPCRRQLDRRSFDHPASPSIARGQLLNRSERAHAEVELVEVQCAQEAAQERLAHAIAAAQLLVNELRQARAASVAARRAARDACGVLSGETT